MELNYALPFQHNNWIPNKAGCWGKKMVQYLERNAWIRMIWKALDNIEGHREERGRRSHGYSQRDIDAQTESYRETKYKKYAGNDDQNFLCIRL